MVMTLLQLSHLLAEVGKQLLNVACVTRDAALVQEAPEVGRNLGVICIAASLALKVDPVGGISDAASFGKHGD